MQPRLIALESGQAFVFDDAGRNRGASSEKKTIKTDHTWLAGFPGPQPLVCGRGLRISRSRSVLCPLPRSCPVSPQGPAGRRLGSGGSGPPGSLSPDEPWAHCNLGTSFGCPRPGSNQSASLPVSRGEKTTHVITRVCPGSPSPSGVSALSLDSGGLFRVAVARMIDVQRRDMLSYTECKASPGAGGLVGLRRVRSRTLCVSLRLCCCFGSGDGLTHGAAQEAELSRPARPVCYRTGPLI